MSAVSAAELAEHPFASGLAAEQLERLAALAVAADVRAGQRLFDEGGQAATLWLIRNGQIALDLGIPGRERLIVETLGAGDELGLSWLVPPAQWQFGAIAQATTAVFELTRRLLTTAISRLQAARIRILDLYAAPPPRAGGAP
jgi:CRP/FNR family transcriptional regulator, cyclic AMP receptor protein